MRTIIALTFAILIFRIGNAQIDSISDELKDAKGTKSELISKARVLLLDHFLTGDISKVEKIESHLSKNLSDDHYFGLYPIELSIIKFWTGDYNGIISNVVNHESVRISLRSKVRPQPDDLFMILKDKSGLRRDDLIQRIHESVLSPSDKKFLVMFLNFCIFSENSPNITQDTLNNQADDFLKDNSRIELAEFTRKYIRYKLVPSKWSFAFEFFSGYGFFSGNLQMHYQNNIPVGIDFDVAYKNFTLYLRDYIGLSFTKHDFSSGSTIWKEGSQVRVFLPEASIGYNVKNCSRYSVTPFAGISSTDIGPTSYDLKSNPQLKDYELKFTATYTVGVNADWKIKKSKSSYEESYWFVRLRYAYNFPQLGRRYPGFNGDFQYLSVGIGSYSRRIKRD